MPFADFVSRHSIFRRRISRLRGVLAGALIALFLQALGVTPAPAAGLYEASVPFEDRSEAGRIAAFQAAMRQVLARVTSRGDAGAEPALAPLVTDAARYVQQYRLLPDGQLFVGFDGRELEQRIIAADPQGLREVKLTIVGINTLKAYAAVTAYLETQRMVREIEIEKVSDGAVSYQLRIHGDTTVLTDALAQETRLVSMGTAGDPPQLQYRWTGI